ncbi:MAG TPA: serine/threonine-protein kinase [Candidatus Obscuribacterales bacterium]
MSEQISAESTSPTSNRLLAGKYEVLAEISRGGFGRILKVRQTGLHKVFAAKILADKTSAEEARRLAREGQILTKLSHPNILKVYSADVDQHVGFLVIMDYLDGVPVSQLIREKQLNVGLSVRLFKQMCAGLSYAHENGVLHRDLKPSNVMVIKVDEQPQAVLIDFGIAKLQDTNQKLTQTGALLGTPLYMSPEQLAGQALDVRSDVYSLGCVLYEMLTGEPPFQGATWMDLAAKHQLVPVQPPSALAANIPAHLEDIVIKCLAKKPENRYQTVSELVETVSTEKATSQRRKHSARRNTLQVRFPRRDVIIGCSMLALLLIAGVVTYQAKLEPFWHLWLARHYRLDGQYSKALEQIDESKAPATSERAAVELGLILFGQGDFANARGALSCERNRINDNTLRQQAWLWGAKSLFFKGIQASQWEERKRSIADANGEARNIENFWTKNRGLPASPEQRLQRIEANLISSIILNRQALAGAAGPRWGSKDYLEHADGLIADFGVQNVPQLWLAVREESKAECVQTLGHPEQVRAHLDNMQRYLSMIGSAPNKFQEHEDQLWANYLLERVRELRLR